MKAITTTYYGPTNTLGSRIVARDEDNNRVTLSYASELSGTENHDAAAKKLCVKMDWVSHDLVRGGTKSGYVYVFDAPWEHVSFAKAERAKAADLREKGREAAAIYRAQYPEAQ